MGTVFKKKTTRPPAGAEIAVRDGRRVARWRVRGKPRTAQVTSGVGGRDRVLTESRTYYAKYRDHAGTIVVRPTGCRDEQAARQMLARWDREVDQIRAGALDPKYLYASGKAAAQLEEHLTAYERSLVAAGVSDVYRENALRAIRRVAADCGFAAPRGMMREAVEDWLAARIHDGMGARTRNYYRELLVAFANWCEQTGRLGGHDLHRVPKADPKADPRRQRRALTEGELTRLLAVAAVRPLADARTVRRDNRKGERFAALRPETVARLQALGREQALVYKTLVLTGLRRNELRTLTIGQLDLTSGREYLQLDAADEKSGEGNAVAIRDDLAADLRAGSTVSWPPARPTPGRPGSRSQPGCRPGHRCSRCRLGWCGS